MVTAAQAKAISERYAKAVELVEAGRVFPVYGYDGHYAVVNGDGQAHLVRIDELQNCTCTCPDFQFRARKHDIPCKHILAAQLYTERQQAGESPAPRPAASCEQCGATIEAGRLCDACAEKARELFRELVG